jgi:radical SAM-linked protein
MDPREQVREKQGWLRDEARASNVKLRLHGSEGSWLDGELARGERTHGAVNEHACRSGARFDSWEERLLPGAWADAFEACGVDPSIFLGTIPLTARLPWDHIDVGLEEGFLAREYRKALANRLSPPCGKAAGMFVHHTSTTAAEADPRRLVCYDCGVACDMTQMREERLVFLRQLGAETPPPPREPQPLVKAAPKHRAPPPQLAQGRALRVRMRYAKLGRAAYRGHLDLVRVLPRIFRRVGMPLYYSAGFHPKPEMVFGPAHSLGVTSLGEYVDVKIDGDVPFDLVDLASRLNAVSELGLVFLDAIALGDGDRRVTRAIDEAVYVAGIPHVALAERGLGSLSLARGRAAERIAAGALTVVRTIEGIGKKVDVGRYLIAADVGAGEETLERAGIGGRLVPIRLEMRIEGGGAARPSEAIEAILGERELPMRLVREALFANVEGARVAPHDLAALRSLQHGASKERSRPAQDEAPFTAE